MNRTLFALSILMLSMGVSVGSTFFVLNTDRDISENSSLTPLIEQVAPVTVSILGSTPDDSGAITRAGTGIIVETDGKILTSKHIVSKGFSYTITFHDGTQFPAKLEKSHPSLDLALLSIVSESPLSLPVGKFINSQANVAQGESVVAIGNTLGLYSNSVSIGIIAGLNRTVSLSGITMNGLIQTTIPMNFGNSGGPLIAPDGKIIGINTGIVGGSSQIGWTLPLTQDIVEVFLK